MSVCGNRSPGSHIAEVTTLPIIADADTGFGNAVNARRTIRTFERIGMVAVRPAARGHQSLRARTRGNPPGWGQRLPEGQHGVIRGP